MESRTSQIALLAICKNESPYLVEWIAYHKTLGFNNIFIYDNVSDDGCSELLASLDYLQEITRIHWPRLPDVIPQTAAYGHFYATRAGDYAWVLVIDIDEFLVLNEHSSIQEFCAALEKDGPEDLAEVRINWRIFGSNGHKEKTDGLVIERFTDYDGVDREGDNTHKKSMARPEYVYIPLIHHNMLTHGQVIRTCSAVLNHYITKSDEELILRSSFPGAHVKNSKARDKKYKRNVHMLCVFNNYDGSALKNIEAVKEEINRLEKNIENAKRNYNDIDITVAAFCDEFVLLSLDNVIDRSETKIRMLINDKDEIITNSFISDGKYTLDNQAWLLLVLDDKYKDEQIVNIKASVVGSSYSTNFSDVRGLNVKTSLEQLSAHFPNLVSFYVHSTMRKENGFIRIKKVFRSGYQFSEMLNEFLTIVFKHHDAKRAWAKRRQKYVAEYPESRRFISRINVDKEHFCHKLLFPGASAE